MKFLLKIIEKNDHHFQAKGKLSKLHPLYDALTTFIFTPAHTTHRAPHVRDHIDLKRLMFTVVVALLPCVLFSFYNTGLQTAKAYGEEHTLSLLQMFANGAILNLPIILVSYSVGGLWEGLFAIIRRHKISEGFLVTGLLFPLTLPSTIPLWQVAIGISFGVVIGKEIFGGTGMNILNPALTARVFLFFSFPANISGDTVWVKLFNPQNNILDRLIEPLYFHNFDLNPISSYSGATANAIVSTASSGADPVMALSNTAYSSFSFMDLFLGFVPGSMGETSTLACLIGAFILIVTRVGSWRIMLSVILGGIAMSSFINLFATDQNPSFLQVPFYYQLVMGSFLFAAVFMATDPVSATGTNAGKWIYGFLIGSLCILIRIWNPAYPEGMMLAIIFMNIFSPVIDHYVVQQNIKRRLKRASQ